MWSFNWILNLVGLILAVSFNLIYGMLVLNICSRYLLEGIYKYGSVSLHIVFPYISFKKNVFLYIKRKHLQT